MASQSTLLVIFGAGASFDSIRERYATDVSHRPPLTRELFGPRPDLLEVAGRIPTARPLIARMRGAAEREVPVESELRRLRDEQEFYPERKSHLVALSFYLQWVLEGCTGLHSAAHGGITNYVELVDRIERWRARQQSSVAYATFNYDTLLESAITDVVGESFASMDRYVADRGRPLYRPHGSWRWGRVINQSAREMSMPGLTIAPEVRVWGQRVRETVIASAASWELADEFRVLRERDALWAERPHQQGALADASLLVPALSIPVDAKSDFSMPNDHLEHMRATLASVNTVVAIGWRATEAHFLSVLESSVGYPRPTWHLVSPRHETVEETARRLSMAGVGAHFEPHLMGFSVFLDSPELAGILRER